MLSVVDWLSLAGGPLNIRPLLRRLTNSDAFGLRPVASVSLEAEIAHVAHNRNAVPRGTSYVGVVIEALA